MLARLRNKQDDSWKDYPTAGNLEWLLHLQVHGAIKETEGSVTVKLLDGYPPETIHSKVLARLGDERKPPSLKHPEAQRLIKESLDFERKALSKLRNKWGLIYDRYFQEKRFWLKNPKGKRIMSGLYNALLFSFNKQYGIILQHYFTHLAPPLASKSKELEFLAIIAHKTFGLKKIFANSLWVPNTKLTTVIYTEDQLHTLHQQLQMDLRRFQDV